MIKAVITAAGKGTRLSPITKEIPKEMMPIFLRTSHNNLNLIPMSQFIFEQLYSANIRDFCFVVGRGKRSVEDHFMPDSTYLTSLTSKSRILVSNFYKKIENSNIVWINQNKPLGFGDAIKKTMDYNSKSDFVVHAGDVVIISPKKYPILRLIKIAKNYPNISAVVLCKKVKDSKRYGVPKLKKISQGLYSVEEVEEKPDKPKSSFGLLPIYYFKPDIFDGLKKIKPGKGNEFQLTDAIQKLIESGKKVLAVSLNTGEIEIDVGTAESYWDALNSSYKKG